MGLEKFLKALFHPCKITGYGLGFSTVGTALFFSGSGYADFIGAGMVAAGSLADLADGKVARKFNLCTREGVMFDTLADKVKDVIVSTPIAIHELANNCFAMPVGIAANFAVNYFSQRQKGSIVEHFKDSYRAFFLTGRCESDVSVDPSKKPNLCGKVKATLQMGVGSAYLFNVAYQNHFGEFSQRVNDNISYGLTGLLLAAATLGAVGVYKRVRIGKERNQKL